MDLKFKLPRIPEFKMKIVSAQNKSASETREARMQDLYLMAQESTIYCKFQKTFLFSFFIVS